MPTAHWLVKSEPDVFSIDRLAKEGSTRWDGVRNYQARNFLKAMGVGDLVLYYHSNDDRAVVGVAKCVKTAYPEPIKDDPDTWVQVEIAFVEKFPTPIPLSELKASPEFRELLIVTHSRLSVMSIPTPAFREIVRRGRLANGKKS